MQRLHCLRPLLKLQHKIQQICAWPLARKLRPAFHLLQRHQCRQHQLPKQRSPAHPGGHALQEDDGLGAFPRHGHGCDSGNAPGAPVLGSAVQRPFHFAAQAARVAAHPEHHLRHQHGSKQNQQRLKDFLPSVG